MFATQSSELNPNADVYIPLRRHQFPLLPPPPHEIPLRRIPPPPQFFSTKLLVPPPPTVVCQPVQIVWRPVTYSLVKVDKSTTPEKCSSDESVRNPPVKGSSEVGKQTISTRLALTRNHLVLPPRLRLNALYRKPCAPRRRNFAHSPDYPFGKCTTLMIRNIPNRLKQGELVSLLAEHCADMKKQRGLSSEFDFVYLPVDFIMLGNKGYAFVNFTTIAGAIGLFRAWNHLNWDKSRHESKKTRVITAANIQGTANLKAYFERSIFLCDTDEYLPAVVTPPCNGDNISVVTVSRVGTRRSPCEVRRWKVRN